MKIAICLPVHGDTRALFTYKLARMLVASHVNWPQLRRPDPLEIELFLAESSSVARNREWLSIQAENWKADAILWLDSDQTFPAETLLRLVSLNLPVVGCNSPRREEQARPSAKVHDENGKLVELYTTREKIAQRIVEPVAFMGLPVCLVRTAALEGIERPHFSGENEDFYFFTKLRAAGIEPMLDHLLSGDVGHIRNQLLTNDHSLAARPRTMELPVSEAGPVSGKLDA